MSAATAVSAGRSSRDRFVLLAFDLVAVVAAVVLTLLLRSGFRDFDPLSVGRLAETVKASLPVCVVALPLALALCGRYTGRADALDPRRASTAALLGAGVVSVWSLESGQAWWLFLPVVGSIAWTAGLILAGRAAQRVPSR